MNFKLPTTNNQTPTGFTLIETLVALTILTLAATSALFVANTSIVASSIARDKLITIYLSQEGIEHVRMVRDNYYLAAYQADQSTASTVGWNNFSTGITPCLAPNVCSFDPVNNVLAQCMGNCAPLYRLSSGVYSQQNLLGSEVTPFTREIRVTNISGIDKKVTSTVSWTYHGVPHSVVTTVHLTPWQ